jgi:hypothetical protein
MARPNSSKILVKRGKKLHSLMWANITRDGTVIIGFPSQGKEHVELVIDGELGELRPPEVVTEVFVGRPKISFHPSGQYKLETRVGKTTDSMDRVTVECPPLADISDPRRMVELLLPKLLPLSIEQATDRDIVLDATSAPDMPLRCTISCMSLTKLEEYIGRGSKFVDTSVWEYVHALSSETHVWVWTLRVSKNDNDYPNRFFMHLIGKVKWGQLST